MDKAATFEPLRGYLFSIAYRMLGDVGESEDVVQEAFLRWTSTAEEIESPKAYLAKVTTRLCMDRLRSARSRRETYVGPWLPEPLATDRESDPAAGAEQADSLSLAFLVVLESLSPVERAVFLLREVFEYEYPEVADAVGVTEVNARQIAHRARQHIASRRPRFETPPQKRQELTKRFLRACDAGEMEGLTELLSEDIVLYSDGGGRVQAARRPIEGAARVARFLVGILAKAPADFSSKIVDANGQPAVAVTTQGRLTALVSLDIAGDRIREIHIVVNPAKLAGLERALAG